MTQVLILLMLLSAPPEVGLSVGPKGPLLGWLIQTGRMKERIDTDRLDRILRRGEVIYLDGGSRSAAALFGSLLLDPSFWELSKTPSHDNLRYDLAGALVLQGAYGRAREILLELVPDWLAYKLPAGGLPLSWPPPGPPAGGGGESGAEPSSL